MASSVPSYVNFQSTGSSSHLTRYADGSFLTVWTSFDRAGAAYVYGKAFKADGTVLRDTFLIDSAPASAAVSYSKITATTLNNGQTVLAWLKSNGDDTSVVGKVLGAGLGSIGETLDLSIGVNDAEAPRLHALSTGGFAVLYRGSYVDEEEGPFTGVLGHTLVQEATGSWDTLHHIPLHNLPNDSSSSTVVLGNGIYVAVVARGTSSGTTAQTYVQTHTRSANSDWSDPIAIDTVPGTAFGINPTVSSLGDGRFVVAWEDVEGAGRVIRAQVFDSAGTAVGSSVSFAKPNGTLEGTPVIKPLTDGGFAIAFIIDVGNDDENIYTAAVAANGTIITNTTFVGTSTAGDQWDPSLIALNGNNYAVSWMSDTSTGQQFFVEVIGVAGTGGGGPGDPPPPPPPPPPPGPNWTGTEGNDAHTGNALSETFYGLGGKDKIRGGAGNDTVDGGTGNDKIWGGTGNDVLMGRDGFDIFVFDTKPNKDHIVDFGSLFDSIWLDNKVFTKLGKKGSEKNPAAIKKSSFALEKAKDKDDYIIYSKKKATIYYDADGSGSKYKAVEIATVKKGATVTHWDFYVI
jgi:serralysin